MRNAVDDDCFACLHGATGDEDGGDIETKRGIEHARGDFVAIGDAYQGVGSMRVYHVLDGIGDDLARRQGVEHASVAHGDAVIDRDGVEFLGHATSGADCIRYDVADVFKVNVSGHKLCIGVCDRHDGFAELMFLGAGCAPERSGARGLPAYGCNFRAQRIHGEWVILTS